jgi:hypothetical protein
LHHGSLDFHPTRPPVSSSAPVFKTYKQKETDKRVTNKTRDTLGRYRAIKHKQMIFPLVDDTLRRTGDFLDESNLHTFAHLSTQFRDAIWSPLRGQTLHIFVTAANIDQIIEVVTSSNNTLDHASFEIKVFDPVVQARFEVLSLHVRKLKINFRAKGVHTVDYGFPDTVVRALDILRRSPWLASLYLNFHTSGEDPLYDGYFYGNNPDGRWFWSGPYTKGRVPRLEIGTRAFRALAMLKEAPNLRRLYIDLSANNVRADSVSILAELYASKTIHTLSLKLNNNPHIGLLGAFPLTRLQHALPLKSLHLGLFNIMTEEVHAQMKTDPRTDDLWRAVGDNPSLEKLYLELEYDRGKPFKGGLLKGKNLNVPTVTLILRYGKNNPDGIGCDRVLQTRCNPYGTEADFIPGFTQWNDGPFVV